MDGIRGLCPALYKVLKLKQEVSKFTALMYFCMFASVILKFVPLNIFSTRTFVVWGLKLMFFFLNLAYTNYDALVLAERWLNSNVFNRELFD